MTLNTVVHSDWAGDPKTRCSTSGGVIFLGWSPLKHWSSTQSTVSLSSAEAELKAIVKGRFKIEVWTDSSSAKAITQRLGPGKRARHIDVQNYWLQEQVKEGIVTMCKVRSEQNVADALTKYLPKGILDYLSGIMGHAFPNEEYIKYQPWSAIKDKHYKEQEGYEARLQDYTFEGEDEDEEQSGKMLGGWLIG
eukprot:6214830-Amphidinium_carterae.2